MFTPLFTFNSSYDILAISGLECLIWWRIIPIPDKSRFWSLVQFFSLSSIDRMVKNFGISDIFWVSIFLAWSPNVCSRLLMRWGCDDQALFLSDENFTLQDKWSCKPITTFNTSYSFEKLLLPHLLSLGFVVLNYHLCRGLWIQYSLYLSSDRGMNKPPFSKSWWSHYNIASKFELGQRCTYPKWWSSFLHSLHLKFILLYLFFEIPIQTGCFD